MTGTKQMKTDLRRIEALYAAFTKAQDPEFQELWSTKLSELLEEIKNRPDGVVIQ